MEGPRVVAALECSESLTATGLGCGLVFKFFEADTKILDCFAQSIGKGGCLINSIRIQEYIEMALVV